MAIERIIVHVNTMNEFIYGLENIVLVPLRCAKTCKIMKNVLKMLKINNEVFKFVVKK